MELSNEIVPSRLHSNVEFGDEFTRT